MSVVMFRKKLMNVQMLTKKLLTPISRQSISACLGKPFESEGLLGGPLDIKTIKPIAGFDSR